MSRWLPLLALFAATASAGTLADADALLRQGEYTKAADALEALGVERPDDPDVWSRLGAARYRAGDHEGAARAFDAADRARGGTAGDDAFNAGNAHWLAGRLEDALARYDAALARDPGHAGAQANRTLLLDELAKRRNAKQDPKQDPAGEQGEQGESGDPNEPGDPQQGEAGDASAEGSPGGDPQQGNPGQGDDPSDREADGAPPQETTDAPSGQAGGHSDQEREPDVTSETVRPGEVDPGAPADPTATGRGAPGVDDAGGPLSEAQAERLLQGVEEGRPRVSLPGRSTDRPW